MRADFEDRYHRVEAEHWWFAGRRELLSRLLERVSPDRSQRVLDVGCSGGATMLRLREDGYTRVVGIDISPEAIARCHGNGLAEAYVMDGQDPAFPAGSFDLILASDVLEHVPDEDAAMNAWFRLLRPGGVLIALVPAFMALWSPHDEANQHRKRYRLAELRACAEASGFAMKRSCYWNFLLFLPAALVRMAQRALPSLDEGHAALGMPPAPVNALLRAILVIESRLLGAGLSWPWGLSALVVAQRPAGAAAERDAA